MCATHACTLVSLRHNDVVFAVTSGLSLVVARLPDQWLHGRLFLHLLYTLLRQQAGHRGLRQHAALLRLHLHHGLRLLPAHRSVVT